MTEITAPHRQPDALPPALRREAIQQFGAALSTWGLLLMRAADISPAPEVLEITRGARRALIAAIDEAKALAALEEGSAE